MVGLGDVEEHSLWVESGDGEVGGAVSYSFQCCIFLVVNSSRYHGQNANNLCIVAWLEWHPIAHQRLIEKIVDS